MNTQTKFTPGPWATVDEFPMFVVTQDDRHITTTHPHYAAYDARAIGSGDDPDELDQCEANARLISSAPDLYAALEALTDWHEWSLDYSERMADEFYRETSMMAPFKDRAAAANEPEERRALAAEKWREWCRKKNNGFIAAARTALASARGEG